GVGGSEGPEDRAEPFLGSVFELNSRQRGFFLEEAHFDLGGRGPVVVLPGVGDQSWRFPAQHSPAGVLFAVGVALVEAPSYERLEMQLGGTVPAETGLVQWPPRADLPREEIEGVFDTSPDSDREAHGLGLWCRGRAARRGPGPECVLSQDRLYAAPEGPP